MSCWPDCDAVHRRSEPHRLQMADLNSRNARSMTTLLWISIGMTVGLASTWIVMRRHNLVAGSAPHGSSASAARHNARILRRADSHQGVTIRPCLEACAVVAAQRGQRYLASEAPELPLAGCDTRKCGCRYRYHADRRSNEDRRYAYSQASIIGQQSRNHDKRSDAKDDRRRGPSQAEPSAYFNNY